MNFILIKSIYWNIYVAIHPISKIKSINFKSINFPYSEEELLTDICLVAYDFE